MVNLWLLVSLLLLVSAFDFSQSQECGCSDFCSTVQAHEFILQGTIDRISQDSQLIKYRVIVQSNLKGRTSRFVWIYALQNDDCMKKLVRGETYILFLVQQDNEFWLSSCFNIPWTGDLTLRVRRCFSCPLLKCKECQNGNVLDSNGCRTCACKPCPDGVPQVQCFAEPCSFQETQCPQAAYCVDDYCGGCHAHYFDQFGTEICKGCEPVTCKMYCENGFKKDENGCEICECNECPNGETPVQCFVEPCSNQETQCPQAAYCVDDYCGGCNAHYFDELGNEICQGCEPLYTCKLSCPNGFKTDENGCDICACYDCPQVRCSSVCEYGFKIDENGCQTCQCNECPQFHCMIYCEYGSKIDENGCQLCSCNECPKGEDPVQCLVQPCSLQPIECPQAASCVDDYCGGCDAHYYDQDGNEICTDCPDVFCDLYCENGFMSDDNGCPICECNICPGGEPPANCFVRPCSLQKTECPQAAYCLDDYCGGCSAHYFDELGTEICTN